MPQVFVHVFKRIVSMFSTWLRATYRRVYGVFEWLWRAVLSFMLFFSILILGCLCIVVAARCPRLPEDVYVISVCLLLIAEELVLIQKYFCSRIQAVR